MIPRHVEETKTTTDRNLKNRLVTITREKFVKEFAEIIKAWGPHYWHKVWNSWQRRLLFQNAFLLENNPVNNTKVLLYHIDFASTYAIRQQYSICCEQPPNAYQLVVVVSTNPRKNSSNMTIYDNDIFSFWAEKSVGEIDKDYYFVSKCLEKVFALFKAEQSKTRDTRSLHVFQLSDQCAAEFKSRNTAWMTATICKQNNIDNFVFVTLQLQDSNVAATGLDITERCTVREESYVTDRF